VTTLVLALGKAFALTLVVVLIVILALAWRLVGTLNQVRAVSPVFAPPLLSRSLPFCAAAGMASKERTGTAKEK
jgi:hypothetical protein